MRKELLIAIFLGFVLGIIITFGIYSANKAVSDSKKANNNINNNGGTSSVTETLKEKSFFLTILKPENESIINTDKTTVTGSSLPNSPVVISWETGETIVQTDIDGNFEVNISLISGINEISATALSDSGEEITKNVGIVYSTEQI